MLEDNLCWNSPVSGVSYIATHASEEYTMAVACF